VFTQLETGDRNTARRFLRKAEIAYDTVTRIAQEVENAAQGSKVSLKLIALRAKLDDAHGSLGNGKARDGLLLPHQNAE
jgi:hypothetical protein